MIIFAETNYVIDATTALAVGGSIAGGIMGAAKLLISYFRDRDALKDRIAEQQYTKFLEQHKESATKYGELLQQVINEAKDNRAERQAQDKVMFELQRETVETISEIKTASVEAMAGMKEALQALAARVESLEKPGPVKLITGETKP